MKIIDRHNFFGIVCAVYTILSLGKIILEAIVQDIFGNYQENLLVMFFFIIGGNICAFSALPVSRISIVTLYCGAICSVGCISNAGYMAFWAFSSTA